ARVRVSPTGAVAAPTKVSTEIGSACPVKRGRTTRTTRPSRRLAFISLRLAGAAFDSVQRVSARSSSRLAPASCRTTRLRTLPRSVPGTVASSTPSRQRIEPNVASTVQPHVPRSAHPPRVVDVVVAVVVVTPVVEVVVDETVVVLVVVEPPTSVVVVVVVSGVLV